MKFLTAGESHGEALTGIISGYPSGIDIDIHFINSELERRQTGYGRGGRMSIERDRIKILSGMRSNRSTGSPISFVIENLDYKNWKSKLQKETDILNPRPGHADLPGFIKFRSGSIRDVIERSSARETASRVAIGAFVKLVLNKLDIFILSYVEQIGTEGIDYNNFNIDIKREFNPVKKTDDKKIIDMIESSRVRCPDKEATKKIVNIIKEASEKGDSLGGSVRVIAAGVVPGLGSYIQWDTRLDARIAAAMMSIPSAKAISIGKGILAPVMRGSEFHDEIYFNKKTGFYRDTNNAGGLEGGMTNGEPIDVRITFKPIPTVLKGLKSVNIKNKSAGKSLKERSDICAVPSAAVVAEAMLAIEITEAVIEKFGRDSIEEIVENYKNYKEFIKSI
jgi:chorismate synthase